MTTLDTTLHRPARDASAGEWLVDVTPGNAGWGYSGLRVVELAAHGRLDHATGEDEVIVIPLAGSGRVSCDGETIELAGRPDPFSGPSDFAYVPRDASLRMETLSGGRFALASARADERLPFRYGPASGVPVELRGAGTCSRAVRNLASPTGFSAQKLIVVEVITPGGNWSSYPPHKHDEDAPGEAVLEEIYYYEIAPGPFGPGLAYQRVYGTSERPIDLLVEIRDRDVVLIPHGWHGPSMAAPGYDLYYLNVMAGPGVERAWRITDDPAHAWVRDTWATQEVDPRLSSRRA
jgi:5-deoxy-glucuronate isomerase